MDIKFLSHAFAALWRKVEINIRRHVMKKKTKFLRNRDFTLISNNCLAGCLSHDFGLQFRTPTVNLYIPFPDYIIFLKNFRKLIKSKLVDGGIAPEGCPIGLLGGG